MVKYFYEICNLPSFIFFLLWVIFPLWLAIRRRQGLIKFARSDNSKYSRYFELGILIFAIPFTGFFMFIIFQFIVSIFIVDQALRFKTGVELTSLFMDIILILYIYLVERRIHVDRISSNK